jgi:hypothetical protein
MSLTTHIFILVMAALTGPILALSAARPVPGELVLVIAPPWIDRVEAISQSGGQVIGPITPFFQTFALSDQPSFDTILKENGAWFVLDGRRLALLCGDTT